MAVANIPLQAFNRGLISRLALARTDLTQRLPWSATAQTNWMPRALGSMMLRPGLEYTGTSRSNLKSKTFPFVFSSTDTAELEMTNLMMRVRVGDTLVSRPAVTTAITNGSFATDVTGWTDDDQAGATSEWDAGTTYGLPTGGYLSLRGTGFNAAKRYQQVTVAGANIGVQHALRIVVARSPVTLRVGITNGDDSYIGETTLLEGTHSLTLTPTGNFFIQFSSTRRYRTFVNSVEVEAAGVLEVPTPWVEADLSYLRTVQSADVVWVTCKGRQQRRIERRNNGSWSVVVYEANDGPFRSVNTGATSLTPSGLSGDITLTASASYFRTNHVGALFRITSIGQNIQQSLNGEDQFTNPIRVTGVGTQRTFTRSITGVFTATYTLQRSVGEVGSWVDVESGTLAFGALPYTDGLDNQIVYYRYGVKTGNYTSGTLDVTMTYANGGLTGIARVTSFTSATSVGALVLTDFGATTGSSDWSEGTWSDYRGWPSAVCLYEGRLWFAGIGLNIGSVSDAFNSFDDTTEGDSGPIQRNIGEGPVDTISWLLPLQRLIIGGEGQEYAARSTSFDEPLTPTNYNVKSPSTQGSSNVAAVKVDTYGLFVQKSSRRIFAISYTPASDEFLPDDITKLCPQVGDTGFVALAAQRMPDTRAHAVRGDGQVAVFITDPVENVKSWVMMQTYGVVEDVWVMPGNERGEDYVYYTVRATINGGTVRYRLKWAQEEECIGGTFNKQADAFVSGTQAPSTTISGLGHLIGQQVVVWADGKDYSPGRGTSQTLWTVNGSGQVTGLPAAVTNYVVGLPYSALFISTKLAYAAQAGTALTQYKQLFGLGLIMDYTHKDGLYYGTDVDHLDPLPDVEDGAVTTADTIWTEYDKPPFNLNGYWTTDQRLVMAAYAPRPVTVLAAILGLKTNERVP